MAAVGWAAVMKAVVVLGWAAVVMLGVAMAGVKPRVTVRLLLAPLLDVAAAAEVMAVVVAIAVAAVEGEKS